MSFNDAPAPTYPVTAHMVRPQNVLAVGPGFIDGVFINGCLLHTRLEWEEMIAVIRGRGMFIDGVLVLGTAGWTNMTIKSMCSDSIQNDYVGDLADHFESQVHALRARRCQLISFL